MNKTKLTHRFVGGVRLFFIATLLAGLAVLGTPPVPVAHAATHTVCAVGCDFTTIQAAIDDGGTINGDTISVTDATHTEEGITVNKDLTIQGQGASNTTVQAHAARGDATDRVFVIASGSTVTIKDMTIRHGNVTGNGGGIRNEGTLTLGNVTVKDNDADDGGGIYNNGQYAVLTLTNCTVSGNEAGDGGGGIYNRSGTLEITDSTLSGNQTGDGGGGGIASHYAGATVTLIGSTVSGNQTGDGGGGGGIQSTRRLALTNSTVSGNTASGWGGGIENYASGGVTLNNCTITDNTADSDNDGDGDGGGIYRHSGTVSFKNTIIAGNADPSSAPDCSGTLTSQGYNLIQDTTGCTISGDTTGNITGQDPTLGPLANNGGPTETHALLTGSPAIDAIPPISCTVATDQRGVTRPQPAAGDCDIGAFEAGPPILRVNKAGSGDGTVTSDVAGINCGADCAEWYDEDTPVTLTATPAGDFVFAGWSGDADCSDGQVTMDADKTCTATFDQAQPPEPVGGIVVPVNKLGLVLPWLGLGALVSLVTLTVALVRRHRG